MGKAIYPKKASNQLLIFKPSLFAENAIIPPNGTVTPEIAGKMPLESPQNTPKRDCKNKEIRYIEKAFQKK